MQGEKAVPVARDGRSPTSALAALPSLVLDDPLAHLVATPLALHDLHRVGCRTGFAGHGFSADEHDNLGVFKAGKQTRKHRKPQYGFLVRHYTFKSSKTRRIIQ